MSDMSFKQAKELVEKIEFTELTLNKTAQSIQESSQSFNNALKQQEYLMSQLPEANNKLNVMRLIVGVNIGFVMGLIIGKYIL